MRAKTKTRDSDMNQTRISTNLDIRSASLMSNILLLESYYEPQRRHLSIVFPEDGRGHLGAVHGAGQVQHGPSEGSVTLLWSWIL